jgi:hypothetical protein
VPAEECAGDYKAVLEGSLNLKVLSFSRKADYKELIESLAELAALVEAEREKLKVNGNW